MGIYDQAPQMYGSMLQNGLDKQFQLATQAQPVTQFLAGLRQAQALKMQQQEEERRAAQDAWQQQKFAEQQDWNKERTGIEDTRYRDNMKLQEQLRRDQLAATQATQQDARNSSIYNILNNQPGAEGDDADVRTAWIKSAGGDPSAFGVPTSNAAVAGENFEGPVDAENPAAPVKVRMSYKDGTGFIVAAKAAQDKLNEGQANRDLRQTIAEGNNATRQMGFSMKKGMESLAGGLAMGKIPPGYRMTPDGNMEAIPGGPGANKESAAQSKASAALEGVTNEMDRLYNSANDAKNHKGLEKTLGWTRLGRIYPGQEAADARALIGSLKAKGGFAVLQAMRASSPTGGALGQVSDKEEQLLQNAIASLDDTQGIDQMKKSLDAFMQYTLDAKARIKNAYEQQFGGGQSTDIHPEAKPTGGNPFAGIGKGGKPMQVGTTRTSKRTGVTQTWNGQAWE